MPSFPRKRESRVLKLYQSLNIPKNQGLDSGLRGNDGVGIAILICYKGRFQTTFYRMVLLLITGLSVDVY